jgi:hypothetical protein
MNPGWRGWYNELLHDGRPRSRRLSPDRVKIFFLSTPFRPVLWPTQSPIQWVSRVKHPGCEAVHSPPTSFEVKKTWIYTSTPSIRLNGVVRK